ncbi:class I SAM-dependent methyltransferase [Stackebrandtia soli]|uniref:class I SAM-dependent methyltransferase n=1 Tax=Stackebrandtia soli TaxID=1892856 RepID=UPI0039E87581
MASTTELMPLWTSVSAGFTPAEITGRCRGARSWLYLAVLAYAHGDDALAASASERAADMDGADTVARAAAEYLSRVDRQGRGEVYTRPDAFAAFIRGGGNVALYRELSSYLRERYETLTPQRVLDIGSGDGLALLPAVTGLGIAVDAVEPSPALAATLAERLTAEGIDHRVWTMTVEAAMADAEVDAVRVAQSTFCLHNLAPEARAATLRWLRSRADRLFIAEFDIAAEPAPTPGWFTTVVERYERGLAEYADGGALVAEGFLMPVMFGYFDSGVDHYEQTAAAWSTELAAAGFTHRETTRLYDYWWAPAVVIEAS